MNANDVDKSDPSSKMTCTPEVSKTGLGSSAAMTTVVIAGFLHYLGVVKLPTTDCATYSNKMMDTDLDLVHVLSQTTHCIAQEKVEVTKPVASRFTSAEIYVVGLRYKAPAKIDLRLLDVKHLFQ
jgi:phosphomevalonate kinase